MVSGGPVGVLPGMADGALVGIAEGAVGLDISLPPQTVSVVETTKTTAATVGSTFMCTISTR